MGYSTTQFDRTSVPTWRLLKNIQDDKEGSTPTMSLETMSEEEDD